VTNVLLSTIPTSRLVIVLL